MNDPYHFTASEYLNSIQKEGLMRGNVPMTRICKTGTSLPALTNNSSCVAGTAFSLEIVLDVVFLRCVAGP